MSAEPLNDVSDAPESGDPNSTGSASFHLDDELFKKLEAERDDLYQRLARATAEFKNSQKRLETEFDQRAKFLNEALLKRFLPVIDNFERALNVDANKVNAANILKGMQIVHDEWLNVLAKESVAQIAPKEGDAFDPSLHSAVMQQESEKYKNSQTVLQTLSKGYALHGRTLRPAQVIVSKT